LNPEDGNIQSSKMPANFYQTTWYCILGGGISIYGNSIRIHNDRSIAVGIVPWHPEPILLSYNLSDLWSNRYVECAFAVRSSEKLRYLPKKE
jgi:hypothetical protein